MMSSSSASGSGDRLRVLVTRSNIAPTSRELLEKEAKRLNVELDWWDSGDGEKPLPREELLKRVRAGVDGIFCILEDKIDAEVLEAAGKRLKVVSTHSVGVDHIDVAECKKRGVAIGNTPGVLTETTADLTMALLLTTARRLPEGVEAVRDGSWTNWKPLWLCGADVSGSTVGIVGLGRIGAAVANRLSGFGCRILYSSRAAKSEKTLVEELGVLPHLAPKLEHRSQDQLFAESDFVIATCALTQETQKLFNRTVFFEKMKPGAIFINTSRGGVVDQEALYEALKEKRLAAAGLDVTSPEPLPTDHPLLTLPNCVILPHIGSASYATRTKMGDITVMNLIEGIQGKPLPFSV